MAADLAVVAAAFRRAPFSYSVSTRSCYALRVRSQSSPRKLSTEQELYASALRALMRRAHSIHEMRQYLARRADSKNHVDRVIARLREQNYLDDARYALDYARQHANSRRQGRFRIARELRARGVPDHHIDAALEAIFAETDEASSVRARLQRYFVHLRGPLDQRKIASLHRSLLRAGFSSDVIRAELRLAIREHEAPLPAFAFPDPPDDPTADE